MPTTETFIKPQNHRRNQKTSTMKVEARDLFPMDYREYLKLHTVAETGNR